MDSLNKIARYFGMTIEPIINFDDTTLLEVTTGNRMLIKLVKVKEIGDI